MVIVAIPAVFAKKIDMQKAILLISFLLFSLGLTAQGTQTTFGKNRVQYHRDFDEWMQYESDNFITYWYGEARLIGQSVVQLAEYDFAEIQNILEHRINEKIRIIVYTDITDLKQSNIGSEEAFTNTGGQTKIVGNKVFVYFNGDHNHLRRQIREGIASVYLNAMLFGSNLQEIVQNAVMMNLPDWFKDGLVAYVGKRWNTDLDNRLRDAILSEEFEGFDWLAEQDPELAGQSLWYFIGENYGFSTVSNLLYLTRINRSVESGFLYVLGSSYETITSSWSIFFKRRYQSETTVRQAPPPDRAEFKNKRNLPASQLKISPDGRKVVYVLNEIGRSKVYLQDVQTGEREVILKNGFRNAFQATDYNYPLLAWNPNNVEVAIMYEERDVIKLMRYDITTGKSEEEEMAPQYQRLYSMDYINPITMVLSGAVRGQSDIFLYYTNTRQTQRITNDFYDDLDAAFVTVDNRKGILFASNRPDTLLENLKLDTILPINTFDLFYYDLDADEKELVRVTDTPLANERQPAGVDTTHFLYLTDRSGIYNREGGYLEAYIHHYEQEIRLNDGSEIVMHADSSLASLDSTAIDTIIIRPVIKKRAITFNLSNYDRNIVEQHTAPRMGKVAELIFRDNTDQIFVRNLEVDPVNPAEMTRFQSRRVGFNRTKTVPELPQNTLLQEVEEPAVEEEDLPVEKLDTGKIDIDNYLFQSEFDDEEVPPTVLPKPEAAEEEAEKESFTFIPPGLPTDPEPAPAVKQKEVYEFRQARIVPYRLQFRTDFVTTQLDNSLLFEGLDNFAANPDGFNYPPPGILLKANFKDLFEDYEFEGGIRVPTTFNGAEYFLTFEDKKKRLDKRYAVYRRTLRLSADNENFVTVPSRREVDIVLGQFGVSYPFDIFRSLRATATLRRDRSTLLATERVTFDQPTLTEQRAGLKLEYVFDNTLDVALNIKNGSRYKVFAEFVKSFDLSIFDEFSLRFDEGFMTILGVDARHYQRLGKYPIFAVRLAAATSFGSERMLYYLGGVDNWLFSSQNNDIPIPTNVNDFAFQTLATNMRGFRINIRNGNSYALVNSELRLPVFRMLSNRIRSSFLRNFQVIGFFDVGTAWTGPTPYSDENPLNTTFIQNGPFVEVKVNYFRDPIVAGYGAGIRTMLFGYFVRLDYAWGIETRQVQDPLLYISLGMDF